MGEEQAQKNELINRTKKRHFESLFEMIICAIRLSLLQIIFSCKLFLPPCFYTEICKAKIYIPLQFLFGVEPRVWGQNEVQDSLQSSSSWSTLHHLDMWQIGGRGIADVIWSCWFRKLQHNLREYPENPTHKFFKKMRLNHDYKLRCACHCSCTLMKQLGVKIQ